MIQEQQTAGSIGFPWTDHLVQVLMDGLPLAVCIHDQSGAIVDYNARAGKLWGGAPHLGDKAGRYIGFSQLYHRDGSPVPLAASPVSQVVETAQAMVDVEIVGERLDGTRRPLLVSVLPLSEHGAISGAISCFHDGVGGRQEEFGEPREWEMMSRLCGSLGHDLANLFQSVRLNVNLVERRGAASGQDLEKPLRGIGQAADRGLVLTRQLLAYAGKQHLDCAPIDINRLLAGLAPQLAALAGQKIRVKLRPASQLWPAHADPEQIRAAVINVVTNACEAMVGGGEITLTTAYATLPAETGIRTAGDYVQISVTDTGPGMERDVLSNVFQPYFTTKRGGAKGLGLSITMGIMRQHRGDIQIDSRLGQGTRVTLSLPRSMSDLVPQLGAVQELHIAPVLGQSVLVVDDDAVVRAAAVDMLDSEGYEVLASASGEEALTILRSSRAVDLLLADVQMNPMSGIELLRQARALRPALKAILISGMGNVKVDPAIDNVTILQKPLRAEEFLRRVREALPT
jgi:signal transduction histidine kinase